MKTEQAHEKTIAKTRNWFFLIVAGVVGFPLILITLASLHFKLTETVHTEAANYDELMKTELISHGWLPESIPRSVRDLRETHNQESNRVLATFYVAPTDISRLATAFKETSSPTARVRRFTRKEKLCSACSPSTERLTVDTESGHVRYENN